MMQGNIKINYVGCLALIIEAGQERAALECRGARADTRRARKVPHRIAGSHLCH